MWCSLRQTPLYTWQNDGGKGKKCLSLIVKQFWPSRHPGVPSPYFDNHWTTVIGGKIGVRWIDSSYWERHCFSGKYTKGTIDWTKKDRDRYSSKKPATWKMPFLIQFVAGGAYGMGTLTIMKTARWLSYLK